MADIKLYDIPADFAAQANITAAQYSEMYQRSIDDPEGFWGEQAEKFLDWSKPWDKVLDWSYVAKDLHIKWFEGDRKSVV